MCRIVYFFKSFCNSGRKLREISVRVENAFTLVTSEMAEYFCEGNFSLLGVEVREPFALSTLRKGLNCINVKGKILPWIVGEWLF